MINYTHTAECKLPLPLSENTHTYTQTWWTCVDIVCVCGCVRLCVAVCVYCMCACWSVAGWLGGPGFWPWAQGSGSRRPASWTFPSERPQGPLSSPTHTHTTSKIPSFFTCISFSPAVDGWIVYECGEATAIHFSLTGGLMERSTLETWALTE